MKVFLYETLGDAEFENNTFSSLYGNIWSCPAQVASGDYKDKFWLAYSEDVFPYHATGSIVDIPEENLNLPEDN